MLTTWDPFAEMSRLQEEVLGRRNGRLHAFRPAVDIFEDKEGVTITTELPGVAREHVSIDVADRVLTITGERKMAEESREGYQRVERAYGTFSRSFALPDTVRPEAIEASMKDGLLVVRLPKREEIKPRRIEVKVS